MRRPFIAFFLAISGFHLIGQGCSDAGFCTMGAMKPDQDYNKRIAIKLRSIEFNYYNGASNLTPVIKAYTVDFNLSITANSSFQIKIPYQTVKGNVGTNSGMSDISLSYTKSLTNWRSFSLNGTLGTKIPMGDSNDQITNRFSDNESVPLPMYYQVSLGSFDAIAGFSMINSDWLFATGIQVALTENNNQFDLNDFPIYPDQKYINGHDEGKNLKRGIDIMIRAEKNWRFTNYNFSLGALPIYRITKDEVTNDNGDRVKLDNTTGLALSVLASIGYQFDVNHSIKLIRGIKLTDRKVNPDGLTRNDVLSMSYIYKF